jgi:hypothetical protein
MPPIGRFIDCDRFIWRGDGDGHSGGRPTSRRTLAVALLIALCTSFLPSLATTSGPGALAGAPVCGTDPGPTQAYLYQEIDFGSICQVFGVGKVADMSTTSIGSDTVRSIKVGSDAVAILYGEVNFLTDLTVVINNISDLGTVPVGADNLSSLKVYHDPDTDSNNQCQTANPRKSQVFVYVDADFSGNCEVLKRRSDPTLENNFIGNDQLSSIKVGREVKVTLFTASDFSESSQTFKQNVTFVDTVNVPNDSVSSLRIKKR